MPLSFKASRNQSASYPRSASSRSGISADLPSGHVEPDRATFRVGDGVQCCVHDALGSADQTAPFDRRAPFFRSQAGCRAVRLQWVLPLASSEAARAQFPTFENWQRDDAMKTQESIDAAAERPRATGGAPQNLRRPVPEIITAAL